MTPDEIAAVVKATIESTGPRIAEPEESPERKQEIVISALTGALERLAGNWYFGGRQTPEPILQARAALTNILKEAL